MNRSLPLVLKDGTRKYVWGLGLAYAVDGTALEVYHTDGLGSGRAITGPRRHGQIGRGGYRWHLGHQ